eukprot:TRINITY_DN13559_c0_g1_i1.p1 TRINITY_DN13559_c0_g1~~TRINITY_DN13559_c0_g1_i1.p1  ORF type:complete len:198 (+),score=91.21 TRINITY_DN13559_c0_g1_i1:69-596(+)
MAPKEAVAHAEESDASDDDVGLLWVSKKQLEEVTKALADKKAVPKEKVQKLIEADDIADDEKMIPVDMSEAAGIEDIENAIDKMGAEKVAQIFVDGRKTFLENLAKVPEDAKADFQQEMTGAEYKKMMEDETKAYEAALLAEEGEMGESEMGDFEEDAEEDGEAAPPAAKKAKTG